MPFTGIHQHKVGERENLLHRHDASGRVAGLRAEDPLKNQHAHKETWPLAEALELGDCREQSVDLKRLAKADPPVMGIHQHPLSGGEKKLHYHQRTGYHDKEFIPRVNAEGRVVSVERRTHQHHDPAAEGYMKLALLKEWLEKWGPPPRPGMVFDQVSHHWRRMGGDMGAVDDLNTYLNRLDPPELRAYAQAYAGHVRGGQPEPTNPPPGVEPNQLDEVRQSLERLLGGNVQKAVGGAPRQPFTGKHRHDVAGIRNVPHKHLSMGRAYVSTPGGEHVHQHHRPGGEDYIEKGAGEVFKRIIRESYDVMVKERKTHFQVLKEHQVELTPEERAECLARKAVWHHGLDGAPSPAVWKSRADDGIVTYVTHTHRAYNTAPTLAGAIRRYHDFIKETA